MTSSYCSSVRGLYGWAVGSLAMAAGPHWDLHGQCGLWTVQRHGPSKQQALHCVLKDLLESFFHCVQRVSIYLVLSHLCGIAIFSPLDAPASLNFYT